jgi:integrase
VNLVQEQFTIGVDGGSKDHKPRSVAFKPQLRLLLEGILRQPAGVSAWLFPSPQRGEADRPAKSLREPIKLARATAGLPRSVFHHCRHHLVSMVGMAERDFMTIAKWVGHRDGVSSLAKCSGHLAEAHCRALAAWLKFASVLIGAVLLLERRSTGSKINLSPHWAAVGDK